jgi:hypothetical protein
MLDEEITRRISCKDIETRAIESPRFWWNNCPANQRKHGIYLPCLFNLENLLQKKYWILGSNFSMYKSDFASINGYDENITGRGGEDINLTARIRLKGIAIKKITQEALQYHMHHSSNPVPHDERAFNLLSNPLEAWAQNGLSSHRPF